MKRLILLGAVGAALFALFAHATLITISGSPGVPSAPSSEDWFATESVRTGVVQADRLETQAIIDDWNCAIPTCSTGDHVTLDTSLMPTGSDGSVKHVVLNTDGPGSGQFCVPLGTTFGNGTTVVFAYQVYFQPQEKYAPWPPSGIPDNTAAKLSILSRDCNGTSPVGSNQVNEFVVQQMKTGGKISAYHQDGVGFVGIQAASNNPCSASDIIDDEDLDRGVSNPLTGTDPDDGGAWTACEQFRAQFGALHLTSSSAGNYKYGLGDPFQVDFTPAGEWVTVQGAIQIGTFGSADSRFILMVARENGPWILLFDVSGKRLGAGPDYNGLNLLPYSSAREAGGRHVSTRSGELESCFAIWNVGPTHATGDGTLSWTASTQRMSWDASGDTPGTARGFSEANDILAVNLISSTSANFVNGKFTPANCPGTDETETVTIATDRPDTQRNYANVIILDNELTNAPDGSAPPVTL